MSTSLQHSRMRERHTIAGAEIVEVRTFINGEAIPPTLNLQTTITSWRLKESLQPRIDDLWKTFCEQVQKLTSDLYSNEITGQPPNTLSDTLIGLWSMGASPPSEKRCRVPGCDRVRYYPWDICLYHEI